MSQQQPDLIGIKRESISVSDFLPMMRLGIECFCEDNRLPFLYGVLVMNGSLEKWALLYFKLRKAKDRAEWFPSGKWATLQRLEQLLEDAT